MFEMWTDPEHFSKWLPPTGFEMEFIKADIRPGGRTFCMMTDGASVKMYGRCEYLKIEKPGTLVYTQQFCDERGESLAAPDGTHLAGDDAHDGRDADARRAGADARDRDLGAVRRDDARKSSKRSSRSAAGMTQGWTGSFDKLEAMLEERRKGEGGGGKGKVFVRR